LAPVIARNISVVPLPASAAVATEPGERLSALGLGQTARVARISPACRGPERRRFMDLGILPGTLVKAEMVSPSGDPTAYLIRRSLIALRKEQAELITITRDSVSASQVEEN
jgi:DtxR family Mn-dependent transcriptional regulator